MAKVRRDRISKYSLRERFEEKQAGDEERRPLHGFGAYYEVSRHGRLYSIRGKEPRSIQHVRSERDYWLLQFQLNLQTVQMSIGYAVSSAFLCEQDRDAIVSAFEREGACPLRETYPMEEEFRAMVRNVARRLDVAQNAVRWVLKEYDEEETQGWISTPTTRPKSGMQPTPTPHVGDHLDERFLEEGKAEKVKVNRYERNRMARRVCIERWGCQCAVCDMSFSEVYGEIGDGFIHVHHLTPLGSIGDSYTVDPVRDLRPVCPNCHAMLHRREPPFGIEELRRLGRRRTA